MSWLERGKILVTGGAGFIGSAMVWALNERGFDNILISDRLDTSEKWRNLVPLRFADYIDADDLLRFAQERHDSLEEINTVFHLGACSSTTETDAGYLLRNNYEFTKVLADWALWHNVRFVYASSAATYGDGSRGMSDQETDLNRLRPLNAYGYSKHLFDLHASRQGWLDHLVGIKYFNVFGPNEEHKGDMRSLVSKAYNQVKESGRIRLFKSHHPDYRDGEFGRDFLYVKDAAAMTIFLAENEAAHGIFNLGSGMANTWIELAEAIFAAMNKPTEIEFIDMPENIRPNYQYFTRANIEKLRSAGYKLPLTSLKEAVSDYVRNYLDGARRLGE
jgi:ADP-L-glycero-D-manno-heptose 6-epimerase